MKKSLKLKASPKKSIGEPVDLGPFKMGEGHDLVIVAGPCVIESEKSAFLHARRLKALAEELEIPLVFKASYDKANRTSVNAFRGPGLKRGLEVLRSIRDDLGLLVLSDVHSPDEVRKAAEVLDIIQIPAFLSRQTDLLIAAGETGKVVNVKKGQFLAPEDMEPVVEKVLSTGNRRVLLTERGASFGYRTLVSDFRSIIIMRELGCPVIYDATHSVQRPGGLGHASGGDRRFAPPLAQAACVVGADAIFMEVHETPEKALSDGPNSIPLEDLPELWMKLKNLSQEFGCDTASR